MKTSRFLIIQGSLQGKAITLANVYAPNDSQGTLFKLFFQVLNKYQSPHLLVGGDFNQVVHSILDRSRVVNTANAFPKTLNRLLSSPLLLDTWWGNKMGARVYTYYSHPYDSYSRLDYIYIAPQFSLLTPLWLVHALGQITT